MRPRERIIVAVDASTEVDVLTSMQQLQGRVGAVKLGLEICTVIGVPAAVALARRFGFDVFLDLKFNDIPNTVARAASAAATLHKVKWCSLHSASGVEAMAAAAAAVKPFPDTTLLAVTVLTSIKQGCEQIFGAMRDAKVLLLAELAQQVGLGGLVCSPLEVAALRKKVTMDKMQLVVPGIRPEWAQANDQKAFATPGEAIAAGADYLVIGRPITNPPNGLSPIEAVNLIEEEIRQNEYVR